MTVPPSENEAPGTAPQPPLHRRFDPSFDLLAATHRIEETVPRLVAHYLRRVRLERHSATLGRLRCALAWQALPGFLAAAGWSVAGSFGSRNGGDEIDTPEFGQLELGDELRLDYPTDLFLFIESAERPERRCVVQFELQQGPFGQAVEITVSTSDDSPSILEPWFEHTTRHNLLLGRNLRAGGRLAGVPGLRPSERLFVADEVRERLELAAQRFVQPYAGRLAALGMRSRSGLILAGAPGTGKTSLCRELSGRLDCTFLWVTPGDLTSEGEVREVFQLARWLAPTVVVLEDLDLVAESRVRGNRSSVLGQLMSELDGASGDHPILTIATTNRLDVIEEAVRNRPGRFDQVVQIGPPEPEGRRSLVAHRFSGCEIDEAELEWFSSCLEGATGAEIEEATNGAIASAVIESDSAGETMPRVSRRHLERSLAWVQRLPARREVGFATRAE